MKPFYDWRMFVAGTVAALAIGTLTASLGAWQLRRADERAAAQQRQDEAMAAPPRELGAESSVAGLDRVRVRLTGRFVPAGTVYLDNRTREGIAGFHVLTPMRLEPSGAQVLVLRGWIARELQDRARLPPVVTPDASLVIEGVAEAELAQPMMLGADAEPGPDDRIWQRLDYAKYRRWSGLPVLPLVVRQNAEPAVADGLARDWIRPGTSIERHQGYAFQWYAMTAVAAIGWLLLLVRQLRGRPRARPVAAAPASSTGTSADPPVGPST